MGFPYLHTDWAECHARSASGAHALVPAVQAHCIRCPAAVCIAESFRIAQGVTFHFESTYCSHGTQDTG